MSLTYRFTRLLVLLAFAMCAAAEAAAQDQAQPGPQVVTAKIRLDDLSMIIVPVSINGSGRMTFCWTRVVPKPRTCHKKLRSDDPFPLPFAEYTQEEANFDL
ncbi:MAG: hypothetical protein QOJ51_4524 [Acidobacteriaceae bacterium]|jgi:hypothetical protein|nr:hypothetical protein [Acidobacteriaceae bacterium]